MAILGLSGLFTSQDADTEAHAFYGRSHDAAACLISEGKTCGAIEEERLTRDKHTFRFPEAAIGSVLGNAGIPASAIEKVAYYFDEEYFDSGLNEIRAEWPATNHQSAKSQIADLLESSTGRKFCDNEIEFFRHHDTHAASAYWDSHMDDALILVSDGNAEKDGISVYLGSRNDLIKLASYSRADSLGHFYNKITKVLGFRNFDEYKVMGLASFGRSDRFLDLLSKDLELKEDGRYTLPHENLITDLYYAGFPVRPPRDRITQDHKDLAAAAQEVVFQVTMHILQFWRRATGSRNLCLAGGVAQNTTQNGRIASSTLFDEVYIPVSPHDAGAALGAAILADRNKTAPTRYSQSPFLGNSPVRTNDTTLDVVQRWADVVVAEESDDVVSDTAAALSRGEIVGWIQDRAEFGPRALGNRSILADPRREEMRDAVNLRIKKREDFRPFAPAVPAEYATTYFELPKTKINCDFMGFVVPVAKEKASQLGAITHVDGTARVQTVAKETNPKFHRLLLEFGNKTGIPVLLNTSFNGSSEPIVDHIEDGISTLITCGLDRLIVGDYVIKPHGDSETNLTKMSVVLRPFVELVTFVRADGAQVTQIYRSPLRGAAATISAPVENVLRKGVSVDTELRPLSEEQQHRVWAEVKELWRRNLVRFRPRAAEEEN